VLRLGCVARRGLLGRRPWRTFSRRLRERRHEQVPRQVAQRRLEDARVLGVRPVRQAGRRQKHQEHHERVEGEGRADVAGHGVAIAATWRALGRRRAAHGEGEGAAVHEGSSRRADREQPASLSIDVGEIRPPADAIDDERLHTRVGGQAQPPGAAAEGHELEAFFGELLRHRERGLRTTAERECSRLRHQLVSQQRVAPAHQHFQREGCGHPLPPDPGPETRDAAPAGERGTAATRSDGD